MAPEVARLLDPQPTDDLNFDNAAADVRIAPHCITLRHRHFHTAFNTLGSKCTVTLCRVASSMSSFVFRVSNLLVRQTGGAMHVRVLQCTHWQVYTVGIFLVDLLAHVKAPKWIAEQVDIEKV